MGTAINSQCYSARCIRGTSTTMFFVVKCYARGAEHAFALARQSGYTPLSLD